jgi:hypothetical protein
VPAVRKRKHLVQEVGEPRRLLGDAHMPRFDLRGLRARRPLFALLQ